MNRSKTRNIIIVAALLALPAWFVRPAPAAAEEKPAATDVDKKKSHPGKKLYNTKTCVACHGKDGNKAIQDIPNLGGQNKAYLVAQAEEIIEKKRVGGKDEKGHPRTEGMIGALINPDGQRIVSKDEIKEIADWLGGIEPAPPPAPDQPLDPARVKQGEELYSRYKCQACHGKDGLKPLPGYPFISGQKKAYILLQIKEIKTAVRTNGKSKLMAAYPTVKAGKDDEFELIAEYLSQVDRSKK